MSKQKKLVMGSAYKNNNGAMKVVSLDELKNKSVVENVKISEIRNPKVHDRKNYSQESIEDLAKNISATGKLLQPIILRVVDNQYERICGFRRIEAVKRLGWESVPSIVLNNISDDMASLIMLSENFQREDINIYDETVGILEYLSISLEKSFDEIKALLYRFRNSASKVINEINEDEQVLKEQMSSIVLKVGDISLGTLINRLKLFSLPENILNALQAGDISYVVAVELNKIKDTAKVNELIVRIKSGDMSLKELKLLVKEHNTKAEGLLSKVAYVLDIQESRVMIKIEQGLSKIQLKKLSKFLEGL